NRPARGRLGLAEGTVASRLVRGRALLAKRLIRHGLSATAAPLVALPGAGSAAVPAGLLASTIQTVSSCARGHAAGLPPAVSELTEGVLHAMALPKLRIAVMTGLFIVGLGLAGRLFLAETRAGGSPQDAPAARPAGAATPAEAKTSPVTCTMRAAGDLVRVRVSFGNHIYHAAAARVAVDEGKKEVVLEPSDKASVEVTMRKGEGEIECVVCDKVVFDLVSRKAHLTGARAVILPIRIGQIRVKGNERTPTGEILDKVPFLRPGERLRFPRLEEARKNLASYDAEVVVDPDTSDDTFADILIAVSEGR
ncbi:MAG TPA: POTRA domain-containing protein, partial [Urbifossiella sp.]|nr:POTRA domain-containing protein [Urbifossiella sp.]